CGHCKSLAPIYEKVAKTFATESNCVVANVDATVYTSIAESYGIGGYPTLKFFTAGSNGKEPLNYDGGRTEADLVSYLNEKCGTDRAVGGGYGPNVGRIAELDKLASELLISNSKDLIIKSAREISKKSNIGTAAYYVRVFEKVEKQGKDFLSKEIARLSKIIAGGNNTPEKIDDFSLRLNVLKAFTESNAKIVEQHSEL
ncbi:hypothetical protein HK096_006793, partial [Nowakowskiella sp. JEL0078]